MDRFKLMETYAAVVRLGSYTRAAKELGVTRALVSKRIQDLEIGLKVKLLSRNTQRLSVTSAGSDYYESCVSLLSELHNAEEQLLANRGAARGEIKILCSKTFGEMILGPIIADFCYEYPHISVHVVLKDMGPHENDLISRGFDLSVRTQPVLDSSLVARPIAELPRAIVAAPAYLDRYGTPTSPEALARHNCLNPNGANNYDWELEGPNGSSVVRVSGSFRANSSLMVRHAAIRGLGATILSEYLVADDLKCGTLVRLLSDYSVAKSMLYVIYQKDRYQPQRIKLFIEFLSGKMKESRSAIGGALHSCT